MNTTQTQVRSTDEALSVFDTLKLALEAFETLTQYNMVRANIFRRFEPTCTGDYVDLREFREKAKPAITAIKESLMSLCDGAQQPQDEVRGLSHSNEQSKCNHTKTITRADTAGNPIEITCGECGEYVAQPEQEPVMRIDWWPNSNTERYIANMVPWERLPIGTLLYTTPPQPKPLTDEQIAHATAQVFMGGEPSLTGVARAIEAAHGIKE